MTKHPWTRRWLQPVLIVTACMVLSHAGYFGLRFVEEIPGRNLLAAILGTVYFISIALGTLYVFPTVYLRGGTMFERAIASLVNPFIWMSAEVIRLGTSHPFIECIYWYFNPLNIWLISFVIMQMGIGTLIARVIMKPRRRDIRVLSTAPLVVIVGSFTFAIAIFAWGEGENIYVLFLKGYRLLFGAGI